MLVFVAHSQLGNEQRQTIDDDDSNITSLSKCFIDLIWLFNGAPLGRLSDDALQSPRASRQTWAVAMKQTHD